MALPPSELKDLLYACRGADEVFDVLAENGCLKWSARRDRGRVRAVVAQSEAAWTARFAGREDECGANMVDFLADALEEAGVLGRKGRRMARDPR